MKAHFASVLLMLPATLPAETATLAIDRFLGPVVAACIIADMAVENPAGALEAAGWEQGENGWIKGDSSELVIVQWPGTPELKTGCSLYSANYSPDELNDWFENRMGPANSIPWDVEKSMSAWRIVTNNHSAGVYVARDINPTTELTTSVIHILQ